MNTIINKKMWFLVLCVMLGASIFAFAQQNEGQKTISRFEFAELLSAAECRDCLSPEKVMADTYTPSRLQTIKASPMIALDDIERTDEGPNTSWFYCVANVVDRGLMQGFPRTTSPYCPGKFCGTSDLTMTDFLDSLIRTLGSTVRSQYPVNWLQLRNRAKTTPGLPIDWYKAIDREIERCGDDACSASTRDAFAVRLQWCRTDSVACGLGNSAALGSLGPRWIVLQNAGVIPKDALLTNAFAPINRDFALQATQYVAGLLGCENNNGGTGGTTNGGLVNTGSMSGSTGNNNTAPNNPLDPDGDGIPSIDDGCPQVYDPLQKDLDKDGIGDVCDDDIDGDGIKNSIGVVDHEGRFNQDLVRKSDDNCIVDQNPKQENTNGDALGDVCQNALNNSNYRALQVTGSVRSGGAPLTVQFSQETVSGMGPLSWDMGDGTVVEGLSPKHTYQIPGRYTVTVKTIGQKETIIALLPIDVYPAENIQVGGVMAIKSVNKNQKTLTIQHVFVGDVARLTLQGQGALMTVKPKEIVDIAYADVGREKFQMQAYNTKGERVGLTQLTFNSTYGLYSHLLTDSLDFQVGKKVKITTVSSGITANEIRQIQWNFGDGTIINAGPDVEHVWNNPGVYFVKQTILFVDGDRESHENIITVVVRPGVKNQRPITMTVDKLLKTTIDQFVFSLNLGDWPVDAFRSCDWTFLPNQRRVSTNPKEIFTFRYSLPGSYPVIAHCITKTDQWFTVGVTVAVDQADNCGDAVCDFDKDTIPDLCDDDIDGDGLKNRLTLLSEEPKDCILSHALIQEQIKNNYFNAILSGAKFDNCPFLPNPEQGDSNKNGYGNACDPGTGSDSGGNTGGGDPGSGTGGNDGGDQDDDGDGIDNDNDSCPDTPEGSTGLIGADGCPEAPSNDDNNNNNNGDNGLVRIDTCTQCPCPEADYASSLWKGDRVRALLLDPSGKIIYRYSAPEIIDEDIPDKMLGIQ